MWSLLSAGTQPIYKGFWILQLDRDRVCLVTQVCCVTQRSFRSSSNDHYEGQSVKVSAGRLSHPGCWRCPRVLSVGVSIGKMGCQSFFIFHTQKSSCHEILARGSGPCITTVCLLCDQGTEQCLRVWEPNSCCSASLRVGVSVSLFLRFPVQKNHLEYKITAPTIFFCLSKSQ